MSDDADAADASSEALAIAAAALLTGGTDALARLPGLGDHAGRVLEAWRGLDRPARARAVAAAVAAVRAARPLRLALVHGEWIEAALAGESEPVRRALDDADDGAVRTWLERHVFGGFVQMPRASVPGPTLTPATLAGAPVGWLTAAMTRAGASQLAHAIAGSPRPAQVALAARLGARGPAVIAALGEIAASPAPASRWGGRRAAIARVAGVALEDRDALAAIGARAFAPHLRGDQPRQLMQRLPRALGLRLAPELVHRGGASEPPPWLELVSGVVA